MRFSVIVPTHNRPELLAAALASVEAQGFTDWECIVVDDGSTVPAVVPADERFRLIRHDTAVGPAAARNSGIAAAQGEVITFLDDDDVYTRDRLWIAADGTRLGADVVICAGEALGGPSSTYPDSVDTLFDRSTTHLGMVAVRRVVCPKFDPNYPACEDIDWLIRLTATSTVHFDERVGWLWRQHGGPRNGIGTEARIAGSRRLLEQHTEFFATHPRARSYRQLRIALMSTRLGDRRAALAAALAAVRDDRRVGTVAYAVRALI